MSTLAARASDVAPIFHFTDEHEALRTVLRQFFAAVTEADDPAESWRRLLDDIGVDDLLVGGEESESSGTPIDLAILAEEAGAALYHGPLLSTAVLGPTLAAAGPRSALLRDRPRAALSAVLLGRGDATLTVVRGADGSRVSGVVEPVWDVGGQGPTVCTASSEQAAVLVVLDPASPGVTATELTALDPSRSLWRVECRDATPALLLSEADAARVTADIQRRGDLVVAAELLGVAQHAFDQTVDYLSRRIQFGRTIGSFQAVKHRLADLLTAVELTRSAVYGAAWRLAVAPESPDTAVDLAVASALAGETATTVTRAAVQLHGGIAITWEHWAHRSLRRAHAMVALTGGAVERRRRLADLIDIRDGHHE